MLGLPPQADESDLTVLDTPSIMTLCRKMPLFVPASDHLWDNIPHYHDTVYKRSHEQSRFSLQRHIAVCIS
jgi:hypothetical protein